LNGVPDADVLYSDHDKIDDGQNRFEPSFKPDWSPDYFRGSMYLGHLLVVRRELMDRVGGCDPRFDGVHGFELALRISEHASRIEHIPMILYHQRVNAGSLTKSANAKRRIHELQALAVQEHLDRLRILMTVETHETHGVTFLPCPRRSYPRLSILISQRGSDELLKRSLRALTARTTYPGMEIFTNGPAPKGVSRHPIHEVSFGSPISFAETVNRMARMAHGEYLLLLAPGAEPVTPDWIERLLMYADQSDIGAVGPLLTEPDSRVRCAGLVFTPNSSADQLLRGHYANDSGFAGSLCCAREVSGVSSACLLVARRKFEAVGGLNERYRSRQGDMDFCLRLSRRGLRTIFVGGAEVVLHGADPDDDYTDRVLLLDGWEDGKFGDPYFSGHFDQNRFDYSIRVPGIAEKAPSGKPAADSRPADAVPGGYEFTASRALGRAA